jgi:Inositol monophosphatase family
VHGFPYTCISINLVDQRIPALGVIYNPFLEHHSTGVPHTPLWRCSRKVFPVSVRVRLTRRWTVEPYPYYGRCVSLSPSWLTLGQSTLGRSDLVHTRSVNAPLVRTPTVNTQRKLSRKRDAFVSLIRSLPGFGDFLTPPSFDSLRSAALHRPIIIITHPKWRSDILILLHDSPPSRLPTPNKFYDRAIRLKDRILSARRELSDILSMLSHAPTVHSLLADLYVLVGRPILERWKWRHA